MSSRSPLDLRFALCALALLALGACTSSNDDIDLTELPNLGAVRGINALAELQDVTFQVVFEDFAPSITTLLFFQTASPQVDFSQREYTFTFDVTLPGAEEATLLAETVNTIDPDVIYDYVLAGTFDDPQLLLWTQPRRDWLQVVLEADSNGTVVTELDVSFGHAAVSAGSVDVYLEAPGTVLADVTPRGTISFGELADPITVEEGTYELTVTAAGDPDTVVFASEELELLAANTALYAVVEDGGFSTQSIGVQQYVGSSTFALIDVNAPAVFSVLHAAPDASAIDVFGNDDFDTPLLSGLAFGQLSGDVEVEAGEIDLTVTPQDDVGVILAESDLELSQGTYARIFVAGSPGELGAFVVADDRRSLLGEGRLRAFNGATRFETLDLYLLEEDEELETTTTAISNLPFGEASPLATLDPGDYELILTEADTTNIIFGPTTLSVASGNVFEIVITDDAESTNADATILQTVAE